MTADLNRLFRFGVIGFLVAAVYVVLYTALFHAGLTAFTSNSIAFTTAVCIQYLGQTLWTFQRQLWQRKQILRFLSTIIIGMTYSTIIVSYVAPASDWRPWFAAGFVSVTLPILNYIAFRLWVYRAESVHEVK